MSLHDHHLKDLALYHVRNYAEAVELGTAQPRELEYALQAARGRGFTRKELAPYVREGKRTARILKKVGGTRRENPKSHPNIEKSGFRRGEYVGYSDGVWRITGGSGSWRAVKLAPRSREPAVPYQSLTAATMEELSRKLTAAEPKRTNPGGAKELPKFDRWIILAKPHGSYELGKAVQDIGRELRLEGLRESAISSRVSRLLKKHGLQYVSGRIFERKKNPAPAAESRLKKLVAVLERKGFQVRTDKAQVGGNYWASIRKGKNLVGLKEGKTPWEALFAAAKRANAWKRYMRSPLPPDPNRYLRGTE